MDRRPFRKTNDSNTMKTKGESASRQVPDHDANVLTDGRNLAALRELGNQLQIKAEKMRLLARAEEGLGEGDANPYTTYMQQPENVLPFDKSPVEEQKPENVPDNSKIPITAARKRRRDKKTKPKGSHTTNVDIKQYRPGYTWNRGGRVKELRIRHLARKFLHIWKKKVFGRVTPSQARSHYRRRLLKLTFRAWNEMWWEMRREWRLEVRAECHHRYVLWQKTFRAWRDFIVKQRIKNTKKALAQQHASCKVEKKFFDAWLGYTRERRTRRVEKQAADEHYSKVLVRRHWGQWVGQHDLVLHRQHMETVALQFWAYRIQAQHWLIWQERQANRQACIQKQFRAVRHHNTAVVQRCLKAWVAYWARRRQKIQEKAYAFQIYHHHVVRRAFQQWHGSYRHQQAILEHRERIDSLAHTFQKRRVFLHWKHYIELVHEKQEMQDLADTHYVRKLKITGLSAFKLSVVQRKVKITRNILASELRIKQLTRGAWNWWMARCENNEELLIIAQSQRARKHHRLVLLKKSFDQLQRYCYWRQYRQSQYAKADAHYYMRVMPECMFRLKVFVQMMKNNRENKEKGEYFRRENLQARFFYRWVNQFEFSKEYRMNERMAILHNEDTTLKRFFFLWKNRMIEVLKEAENEELAIEYYNEVLCRNHLKAWLSYIKDIQKSQKQEIEASVYHHKTMMKTCFHAWIVYTRAKRVRKVKTQRARLHYQRVLCKHMVTMWLHYVDTQRCIRARAEVMFTRKCYTRMGKAFSTWRENVSEQKKDRQHGTMAVTHYKQCVQAKVFKAWHRFAAIHAYKKSETRQWVSSARDHLNHRVLDLYFIRWKQYHKEQVEQRLRLQVATDHHGNKVKLKVMQAWKEFTQQSIQNTLLRKQSDWFFKVRVTARCFVGWKVRLAEARVEKEKTHLALWHWCLGLQRKVTPREQKVTPRDLSVIPKPTIVASPARSSASMPMEQRRLQMRARPRKPDFLVESLKRAGLYDSRCHSYDETPPERERKKEDDNTGARDRDSARDKDSARDRDTAVERLNLAHLDTDRSDRTEASSMPFKMYTTDEDRLSNPASARNHHLLAENTRDREPVQTADWNPSHHNLPPGEMGQNQGRELYKVDIDVGFHSLPAVSNATVPKQHNKFQLMTPADFLQKKDLNKMPECANANFNMDINYHSECQSTATTPRILCHMAGHSHPLSETHSFQVGDFLGEVTPRSVSSLVTPRELQPGALHSSASTVSVQKEVVVIRNRLKSFDQKKKKLRTMQKQLKQLSDWLAEMEAKGHGSDDEDVVSARQEVSELSSDVDALRQSVEQEKGQCAGLVDRVKTLMAQLAT